MYKVFLRTLFVALALCASPSHAAPVRLLVPAYQYPLIGDMWAGLTAAASRVPLTLILNPATGPGDATDPAYTAALDAFRAAGGEVLAYVNTSSDAGINGERDAAAIKRDILGYRNLYPNRFDGIFFDLIATDLAHLAYHQDLYAFVKALDARLLVMGNPGTTLDEAYIRDNALDAVMNFENFASEFDANPPEAWVHKYPAARFAHIVHTQPDAAQIEHTIRTMQARNAGWVFVTDALMPNPYDRLPSYWEQELEVIGALQVPEPATLCLLAPALLVLLRHPRVTRAAR